MRLAEILKNLGGPLDVRHILDRFKKFKFPRRIVLSALSIVGRRDMMITHHHTGDRMRLHVFKHRNYWYMGRRREAETIELARKIVKPGDVCFDVGANIGYISMILSKAVGKTGCVLAFEPDPNNLTYLRENVGNKSNVTIVEAGVGSTSGTLELYTEDLTGQNSSFVKDFEQLAENTASAGVRANVRPVTVPVVTLDEFASKKGLWPRFIKIDVEGFELEVLRGASTLLRDHAPVLVVEVHARQDNQQRVFDYLHKAGYRMLDIDSRATLASPEQLRENVLCVKPDGQSEFLSELVAPTVSTAG